MNLRRLIDGLGLLGDWLSVGGPLSWEQLANGGLLVQHGMTTTTFDANRRQVMRHEKFVARFDDIRWIDVTHFREDDDSPECWAVSLNISWWRSVRIAKTTDDADASIVAARIATVTGKAVKAWR